MSKTLNTIFNWRKNPSSVFYLAIPLVGLFFIFSFMHAYFEYTLNGKYGYFVILAFFVIIGSIMVFFMHNTYKKMITKK